MEHHGFCAGSDCSPGLRPLSKAEIWQLDCHVRCPEYLGTASDVALASSCLVPAIDRKSTRLNSSHSQISYAVFCLKKKKMPVNLLITPNQLNQLHTSY